MTLPPGRVFVIQNKYGEFAGRILIDHRHDCRHQRAVRRIWSIVMDDAEQLREQLIKYIQDWRGEEGIKRIAVSAIQRRVELTTPKILKAYLSLDLKLRIRFLHGKLGAHHFPRAQQAGIGSGSNCAARSAADRTEAAALQLGLFDERNLVEVSDPKYPNRLQSHGMQNQEFVWRE